MPYVTSVERYGREQGMQRGMRQGRAKLLIRQMELKFGPRAAENCKQRVEQADADTLLAWSERILTANTIEDGIPYD